MREPHPDRLIQRVAPDAVAADTSGTSGAVAADTSLVSGDDAVSALIASITSDADLIADPPTFLASVARLLESHEVAVPPEGFGTVDRQDLAATDSSSPQLPTDVEALGMYVLARAKDSAEQDLSALMDKMKALNEAKASTRDAIDDANAQAARGDVDTMGDTSELESLRLQNAIDRKSKMMDMLSTLLKKTSDTATSITQNLK